MWSCEKWRSIRVKEHRNILHEIRKRKANWIGHILHRKCLLKQVIEWKIKGQIEVTRRRKKLLNDLKGRRGYCQLKEEALFRTMWRNHFGRCFGLVVCQITDNDDIIQNNHSVATFCNCWLKNNILYDICKRIYKLSVYQI